MEDYVKIEKIGEGLEIHFEHIYLEVNISWTGWMSFHHHLKVENSRVVNLC